MLEELNPALIMSSDSRVAIYLFDRRYKVSMHSENPESQNNPWQNILNADDNRTHV